MNTVVIVRPAPGWEKPRFNMQTGEPEVSAGTAVGLTAWGEGTWMLNPSDRNALDQALALAESTENDSRVTALALATHDPAAANEVLYGALARGAGGAVLLDTPDYGSDPAVATTVLAAAIHALAAATPVGLVLIGAEAPDGGPDALAPMLAEALGWSQATGVSRLTAAEGQLRAAQAWDGDRRTIGTSLPAVVSVARQVRGPVRYTKLGRELVAYRKGRIDTWDAARLGLDTADAGALTPRVTIRRNALADAPTGERLTGPVDESVAVVPQGLKAQGQV
jgi:electron transfer flavoprotein alpha/beta subunit